MGKWKGELTWNAHTGLGVRRTKKGTFGPFLLHSYIPLHKLFALGQSICLEIDLYMYSIANEPTFQNLDESTWFFPNVCLPKPKSFQSSSIWSAMSFINWLMCSICVIQLFTKHIFLASVSLFWIYTLVLNQSNEFISQFVLKIRAQKQRHQLQII